MSFHTPQAHTGAGSSNYFTPQNSIANASTPRSSSMKTMVTTTPKNVRWPDQQSQGQQISGHSAHTGQSMSSAASVQPTAGPSTPARPQPSTSGSGTPSTQSIFSAARAVSSSLRQPSSPMKPSSGSIPTARDATLRPSAGALRGRVKWNAAAWATLLFLPSFRFSQELYWSFADVVLAVLGASVETKLHATVLWVKWACLLVFIINFFEAAIQLYFSVGDASQAPSGKPAGFSHPPRPASKTKPASSQYQQQQQTPSGISPHSSQIRYNPDSPLKSSLEAANRLSDSTQKSYTDRTTNKGIERRLPSALPSSLTQSSSSGSPLAAYLARRRMPSQGAGSSNVGNASATGADVSEDSFEVDRALRALSNSYLRSSSLSRSFGAEEGPDALSRSAGAGLDGQRSQSVHAGR